MSIEEEVAHALHVLRRNEVDPIRLLGSDDAEALRIGRELLRHAAPVGMGQLRLTGATVRSLRRSAAGDLTVHVAATYSVVAWGSP